MKKIIDDLSIFNCFTLALISLFFKFFITIIGKIGPLIYTPLPGQNFIHNREEYFFYNFTLEIVFANIIFIGFAIFMLVIISKKAKKTF